MATKKEEPKEAAPKEAPAPEGVVMTEALQAELDRLLREIKPPEVEDDGE